MKEDDPIWHEMMSEQQPPESEHKQTSDTVFTPEVSEHPLSDALVETLKTIYDPEIPLNIYDLGLIYKVLVDDQNNVHVEMTLTSPGCPVAQTFPDHIKQTLEAVEGVGDITVEVVWDPPWTQEMMSEEAKLMLGLF